MWRRFALHFRGSACSFLRWPGLRMVRAQGSFFLLFSGVLEDLFTWQPGKKGQLTKEQKGVPTLIITHSNFCTFPHSPALLKGLCLAVFVHYACITLLSM